MRDALADVARRGVWNDEQRRALRAAFQAVVDAFDGVMLLKGKRVSVETTVAAGGALDATIDCPFRPKSAVVLDAKGIDTDTGSEIHLTSPILLWSWTSTPTGGAVRFQDPLDIFPDGAWTLDVFMEKS